MSKRTYSCYGSVRGDCGHSHRVIMAAYRCYLRDQVGCNRQGGYSDRYCLRVKEDGWNVEPTKEELEEWTYADDLADR